MTPMGPITQAAMHGGSMPMPTLATIQKLSNGFVVSYDRAAQVIPPVLPTRGMFPPEIKKSFDVIARAAAGKIAGDEWKDKSEEETEADKPPEPVWVFEPAQIVCKNEDEMIAALRQAVTESTKIEALYREGKLSSGGVGQYLGA